MFNKFLKWGCAFSFALLAACVSAGKPFDDSYVKELKKGITTKLIVLNTLGLPYKESVENGLDTWVYFEKENAFFGANVQKDLVISFDKNNVLKSFRYTSANL